MKLTFRLSGNDAQQIGGSSEDNGVMLTEPYHATIGNPNRFQVHANILIEAARPNVEDSDNGEDDSDNAKPQTRYTLRDTAYRAQLVAAVQKPARRKNARRLKKASNDTRPLRGAELFRAQKWKTRKIPRVHKPPADYIAGPTEEVPRESSISDIFSMLVPAEILSHIKEKTNTHAKHVEEKLTWMHNSKISFDHYINELKSSQPKLATLSSAVIEKHTIEPPSKVNAAPKLVKPKRIPDLTSADIILYLGVLFMMCVTPKRHMKDYWNIQDDGIGGVPWIQNRIGRDRFTWIHNNIRFNLDWVLAQCIGNITRIWRPPRKISLDESLVPFKGILSTSLTCLHHQIEWKR